MSDNIIEWKFGVSMAFCLILYFLGMKYVGLSANMELRIFNFVIHLVYVTLATRNYKRDYPEHFNYFNGFLIGLMTTGIGVFLFACFLFMYLSVDTELMQMLMQKAAHGEYLSPSTVALIILVEGLSTGLVICYVVMRFVGMEVKDNKKVTA